MRIILVHKMQTVGLTWALAVLHWALQREWKAMRCVFCKVLGQLGPIVLGLTTPWYASLCRVFASLINLTSGLHVRLTW